MTKPVPTFANQTPRADQPEYRRRSCHFGGASIRAFSSPTAKTAEFDRLVRASFCTNIAVGEHAFADVPFERLTQKTKITLAWNASAVCLVGPLAGVKQEIFEKYNLDVDLINFGGPPTSCSKPSRPARRMKVLLAWRCAG